jgi:tagaturonate reductase
MQMRIVPVLKNYFIKTGEVPLLITAGFAAFLLYIKKNKINDDAIHTASDSNLIKLQSYLNMELPVVQQMHHLLQDETLWGDDLSKLPGFAIQVSNYFIQMSEAGVRQTIQKLQATDKV